MRMNPLRGAPASALISKLTPAQLTDLLYAAADEPRADVLGAALAGPTFTTTSALAAAVGSALGHVQREERDLSTRRVFQALRIAVTTSSPPWKRFFANSPNACSRAAALPFSRFTPEKIGG